jgi:hypothetical protein
MARPSSVYRTLTLRIPEKLGHTVHVIIRIAHTLIGLAGAAMVSWGASMIYSAAGWIAGGGFLLWLAYDLSNAAGARAAAAQRAQQG